MMFQDWKAQRVAYCKVALTTTLTFALVPTSMWAQLVKIDPATLPKPKPSARMLKNKPSQGGRLRTNEMSEQLPAPESLIVLGQGYNAITGTVLPDVCIDSTRDDLSLTGNQIGPTFNHDYIDTVSNMATNESSSGTDAGFDVTYKLISVGFSTGSQSSSYFNSVDEFARVYKRIVTQGTARIGGQWSSVGNQFVRGLRKNFVQKCGTHYIRGIYYGHMIDETMKFALSQSKYDNSSRNGFKLGVGSLFGFNYSDTTTETNVNSSSSLTIIDNSRGLINAIETPTTAGGVRTLVKYTREDFPKLVSASLPSSGAILLIEVVPYYQLAVPYSNSLPEWPDEVMQAIQNKAAMYQLFLSAVSDLNFALSLPDGPRAQVYKETKDQLQAKSAVADQIQKDFRIAAIKCNALLSNDDDDPAARTTCETTLADKMNAQLVSSVAPALVQ